MASTFVQFIHINEKIQVAMTQSALFFLTRTGDLGESSMKSGSEKCSMMEVL